MLDEVAALVRHLKDDLGFTTPNTINVSIYTDGLAPSVRKIWAQIESELPHDDVTGYTTEGDGTVSDVWVLDVQLLIG